jgi:hypothetical protein
MVGSVSDAIGKQMLVFHSKTHHIEIPEKRKSGFICSWAQVDVKLKKFCIFEQLKPFEADRNRIRVQKTIHKIGDQKLYDAGHQLVISPQSAILQQNTGYQLVDSSKPQCKNKNSHLPILVQKMLMDASPHESSKPQCKNSLALMNVSSHVNYYFLKGQLIKHDLGAQTKTIGLSTDFCGSYHHKWLGAQVNQKSDWVFYGLQMNGHIIRESSLCKVAVSDDSLLGFGPNHWKECKHDYVYTKSDLLFDFDPLTHVIEVGDTKLDSSKVKAIMTKNEACFIDGLFLVSLIGQKPCSTRVLGANLSFVTYPLKLKQIEIVTGHVFDLVTRVTMSRKKLAAQVMEDVKSGIMYSSDHAHACEFVEMNDANSTYIDPFLALFRNTMSNQQRFNITKVKAYFVKSMLVRNQFLNACEMLRLDGVPIEPELLFHGIRRNSKIVADEILKFGFKCDLNSHGTLYGAGGTYGAKEANYSVSGYSEFSSLENKLRNYMFIALVVPGRSVRGTNGKMMGRKEDSFFATTPEGDEVMCCNDKLMIPIVLINY